MAVSSDAARTASVATRTADGPPILSRPRKIDMAPLAIEARTQEAKSSSAATRVCASYPSKRMSPSSGSSSKIPMVNRNHMVVASNSCARSGCRATARLT